MVHSHRDLIQGLVSLATTLAVMSAALFLSAGTLHWPHGLAFLAAFFILVLVSVAWLWRVNPKIFAARRRGTGEGTKSWDLVLISILLGGDYLEVAVPVAALPPHLPCGTSTVANRSRSAPSMAP